eukprot:Gb_27826 [translate_table: standard]
MGLDESGKAMETLRAKRLKSKLLVLLLIVGSNVLTLYLFAGPFSSPQFLPRFGFLDSSHFALTSNRNDELLQKLNDSHKDLLATQAELHAVKTDLKASIQLSRNLVAELGRLMDFLNSTFQSDGTNITQTDPWAANAPKELKDSIAGQKLPFGYNPSFDSDTIYPPVGHACTIFKEDLAKYMNYKPGSKCPSDDILAQKLMLRGCEPLPRRRCYPTIPANYTEPFPFPKSMWTTPPDSSIVWTPYTCNSYGCLINRKHQKVFDDCKDCFDLQGREKTRWLRSSGGLDYGIDDVLHMKNGTIRIGLDIGGGTGTFAVRMRERNVSIVTTSMNFNGPFNNFIASRGVIPLFITVSQRLPFFDNTLDIVHTMHVLSNWIPATLLEFILYDIYRILRPGGVFWLDHFFCLEPQLKELYVPMLEKLGYNKLKWSIGRKVDRGIEFQEMYISALLEKPF